MDVQEMIVEIMYHMSDLIGQREDKVECWQHDGEKNAKGW